VPLDTFLMRLKPVPSPHLVKGRLSASAVRGKAAFVKVQCNYCHPAPLYTDMKFHDAGVADAFDANTQWDTPSLNEGWRTSPYGHLGSYDKMEDIVVLPGHSSEASKLTSQELLDLMEFLQSL
jgi:cytochrome c peroxidase